jgi:transposase
MDVAKAQRDIALRPPGERWAVTNDARGMAALVVQLQALPPTLMVLEATGGSHRAVVAARVAAALPMVGGNPRQGRDCAKATGPWATTDALDARAVAHCAEAVRPVPRPLPEAQTAELRALLARRRQCMARRTAEQNRREHAPRRLRADIEAPIAWLNHRVAALDDDLDTPLRARAVWRERATLSCRVPGMGPVCARPLGLDLPELGT